LLLALAIAATQLLSEQNAANRAIDYLLPIGTISSTSSSSAAADPGAARSLRQRLFVHHRTSLFSAEKFMSTWRSLWRLGIVVVIVGLTHGVLFAQEEEDEKDQPWNVSLATHYLSRFTRLGVDLSQDQPALTVEAGLTHASGISFSADAVSALGTNGGYEQSSFHLGYARSLGELVTLSGVYTYHSYTNDTLSTLASLSSTMTLGASVHVSRVTLSVAYNMYFSGGSANFFTVGASTSQNVGSLTIDPEIQMSFVSQTVEESLLPKNRGKGKGQGQGQGKQQATPTTTTITGLSELTVQVTAGYPLGKGFSLSVTPAYVYSPTDLAVRTSQFMWSAALSYSADF
jgi:hypothetical protein